MTLRGFYDLIKARTGDQFTIDKAIVKNPYYFGDCIYVDSAEDFLNVDSTKTYIVTKPIDMGSTSIVVPVNGISILGSSGKVSKLFSSANNYTMFVNPASGGAGSVNIQTLTPLVTGINSRVFNLNNEQKTDNENNNIDFINVNFIGCTSIGFLSNYRQFFWNIGSDILNFGSLEFSGTWSGGIKMTGIRTIKSGSGLDYAYKFSEATTFASRIFMDINFSRIGSAKVSNITPAHILTDGGFQFVNGQVSPTSNSLGTQDYFPLLPQSSVKAYFDSGGMPRSLIGGSMVWDVEVATNFPPLGGAVKANGGTSGNNLVWMNTLTQGRMTYESTQLTTQTVFLTGTVASQSGKQIEMQLRVWDNTNSVWVIISRQIIESSSPARPLSNFNLVGTWNSRLGDYYELWMDSGLININPATIKTGTKMLIISK